MEQTTAHSLIHMKLKVAHAMLDAKHSEIMQLKATGALVTMMTATSERKSMTLRKTLKKELITKLIKQLEIFSVTPLRDVSQPV